MHTHGDSWKKSTDVGLACCNWQKGNQNENESCSFITKNPEISHYRDIYMYK